MNTYDFSKTDRLFFCGSMCGNEELLLNSLKEGMSIGIEVRTHPMEFERQKRLGKRRAKRGIPQHNVSNRSYTTRGNGRYDDAVIIITGGAGFGSKDDGFFEDLLGKVNELAVNNNSHVLIVRGAFDDPSYFSEKKFNFSNIILVSDYSIVRMDGFDILCVGGGLSIDRQWRKEQGERLGKKLVFDGCESVFDKNLLEETLNNFKVTCIVTNDAPTFIPPSLDALNKSKWAANDSTIIKDMTEQRLRMDGIYSEVVRLNKKPYAWCYFGQNVDDINQINNIRFLASSCPMTLYDVQNDVKGNFGFGLNGEKSSKVSKFSKKISEMSDTTSRERRIAVNPIQPWNLHPLEFTDVEEPRGIGDTIEALDGEEPLAADYGRNYGRTLDEMYRQMATYPHIADVAANTRLALDLDGQIQVVRNDGDNVLGVVRDRVGI